MHHIYRTDFLNDNQFEFTPQKSTTDSAMAIKQFIEPELEEKLEKQKTLPMLN
jgi:hypothetical protein